MSEQFLREPLVHSFYLLFLLGNISSAPHVSHFWHCVTLRCAVTSPVSVLSWLNKCIHFWFFWIINYLALLQSWCHLYLHAQWLAWLFHFQGNLGLEQQNRKARPSGKIRLTRTFLCLLKRFCYCSVYAAKGFLILCMTSTLHNSSDTSDSQERLPNKWIICNIQPLLTFAFIHQPDVLVSFMAVWGARAQMHACSSSGSTAFPSLRQELEAQQSPAEPPGCWL